VDKVFVWYWRPGAGSSDADGSASEPVCAGELRATGRMQDGDEVFAFQYSPEYLATLGATSIFTPDLPLQLEPLDPSEPFGSSDPVGLSGALRDAAPDFWGRRVVNLLHGLPGPADPTAFTFPKELVLPELTYLMAAAGTNRIGALDFQLSGTEFKVHDDAASLAEIIELTELVLADRPIPPELLSAARCATGIGGWRPKALLNDGDRQLIAKFEHPVDERPMVQLEAVSMLLAPYAGIPAESGVEVIDAGWAGKVMLIERFDRPPFNQASPPAGARSAASSGIPNVAAEFTGARRQIVSMRSALSLNEQGQGAITYPRIADAVRTGPWANKTETLHQLFRRLVYSILVSNKDDHLRNTAAFWDGRQLTLTPAFDIAPQSRMQYKSAQFPGVTRDGQRASQLRLCHLAAPEFNLSFAEADAIIDDIITAIRTNWNDACDQALLTKAERDSMMGREFLHPYAFADAE